MNEKQNCVKCGREFAKGLLNGICTACLMRAGLEWLKVADWRHPVILCFLLFAESRSAAVPDPFNIRPCGGTSIRRLGHLSQSLRTPIPLRHCSPI